MANILVIGCGDVGSRLALLLASDGHCVYGVRRSAHALTGVTMLQADVSQPLQLPMATLDYVFIILSPDSSSQAAYEQTFINSLDSLQRALEPYNLKRVFFISSTSVYGEDNGEWVSEETVPKACGFNGQVLIAAESLAKRYWPTTIVRFGGIYGEGRLRLIRWVESGKAVTLGQWTNRIHATDAARLLAFLANQHQQGRELAECYVGVDDYPCVQDEVLDWLADELSLSPVPKVASTGDSNKRISNQRLKMLGYQFIYPSFKEGYAAVIPPHDDLG